MKNYRITGFLIASALVVMLAGFTFSDKAKTAVTDNKNQSETIEWISFEEAEKRAEKNPKLIFVDVYTDWCGWCKKMDKDTFTDPEVAKYINKNFYAVKFNAEGNDPVNIKRRTYNLAPGYKTHELALELLNGKLGYPTTVYLDSKMNVLEVKPGYLTPEQFMQVLTVHTTAQQTSKGKKKK